MQSQVIVFASLVLMDFFGILHIPYIDYLAAFGMIGLLVWKTWLERDLKTPFNTAFALVLIGCVCSILSSNYFEGTDLWKDFIAYLFIFHVFSLLVLVITKTDAKEVEDALVTLSFILCGVYILQFISLQFGHPIIPIPEDEIIMDTSSVRIRIHGSGLAAFAIFYGINNLLVDSVPSEKKVISLCLIPLGFMVIVLMAFRTMFVGMALCIPFLCYRVLGFSTSLFKYLGILLVALILSCFTPIVQEKIAYTIEKQMSGNQSLDNDDYARVTNIVYHYTEHFKSNVEYFFGSGLTKQKSGAYAEKQAELAEMHMRYVDWGLLGLSWMIGVIPVFGMLLYCYKVFRMRYRPEHMYIFVFFAYLLLISLLTNEFARTGNFIVQALLMYLAFCYQKKKGQSNDKRERLRKAVKILLIKKKLEESRKRELTGVSGS